MAWNPMLLTQLMVTNNRPNLLWILSQGCLFLPRQNFGSNCHMVDRWWCHDSWRRSWGQNYSLQYQRHIIQVQSRKEGHSTSLLCTKCRFKQKGRMEISMVWICQSWCGRGCVPSEVFLSYLSYLCQVCFEQYRQTNALTMLLLTIPTWIWMIWRLKCKILML